MSKQIGFDWRRVLGFASAGATIAIGGAAADARAGGTDGWEGRYVACWGNNGEGQCSVPFGLATTTSVAGGYGHTVALKGDGTVACWGWNYYGQCNVPAGLANVIAVAAGEEHTVALKSDATVACWGSNGSGQCNVPAGLAPVTAVAAGVYHTVALKGDATVACWGSNGSGECNVPAGLAPVIAVAAGYGHTVALKVDGTVACWGWNAYGQCNVPAELAPGTAVSAGFGHTVALKVDGTVACWGYNYYGECNVPAELVPVIAVAAGWFHTVALTAPATYPVRALGPDLTTYSVFQTIATALMSQSNLLIESTSISQPGFNASGQTIHGVADLNIAGPAALANASTLLAEGKLTINGDAYNDSTSVFRSNLVTTIDAAIDFKSISNLGIKTIAPSATRVRDSINLSVGAANPTPDLSCAHRLILDSGVYSSNPLGATDFARFDTCTDPAYSTVTPCLEFGPLSVIDLPPGNKIISHGPTTTLVGGLATLRNGSSIETDADLAISGSMRVPVGTAISLSVDRVHIADPALSIRDGGELVVEFGSSVQVAAPAKTSIAGSLTVDQSALFSLLGGADTLRVDPRGDARCFGGTIRADQMILAGAPVGSPSTVRGGRLVGVNALVDVDSVRVQGGSVNLATSSLIGDLVTEAQVGGSATVSTIAASGQIFGNVDNGNGKLISIGNLVVVGDVNNGVGSQILAQVGIIYITGNLINNGAIFGNVITAPSFNGGGTGGTQIGDGIRVVGTVDVGAQGELRFVEDLWKFSVCGDVSLACASDSVRFDGAKLSLDGCNGTVQSLEATSADLGCVASAFSGAETEVSLIGELDIATGATVSLVDNFNNAPGKAAEVVYARGLTVKPGATLLTNGIKVVTRNALIQGTVDDIANICVVIDTPDPDMNGDGHVNGIDLAFILAYWGTSTPIADLNDDGIVGAVDLALVLNGWTG